MSLYKRKDSPFWWIKLPPIKGERGPLQATTGTTDKRKAQQVHDQLKVQRWEQDKLGVKARRTWEDACVKFLDETTHKRSQSKDVAIIKWLDPWAGGKYIDQIDRELIDRIKAARFEVGSASTANRYLALIRSILRKAMLEWEWLDRVPKVTLFKEDEGRVRFLTHAEFDRLYSELPPHLAAMALFSVQTGLRQANVRDLQWTQVDLKNRHAWIDANQHKNGKPHAVPLNQTAINVLMQQEGQHPKNVFVYAGKPISNVSTKAWWFALERAEIVDFRWHDLRHTWASWHRQSGTSTPELKHMGGWKTDAMVEGYAHLAPEGLQVAADRLHNQFQSYALATPKEKKN